MRVERVEWSLDVRHREKTFAGKVSLHLEGVDGPLRVDSERLTIDSAELDGRPVSFREDSKKGVLEFPPVSAGAHRLDIAYRGAVDPSSLVGMYTSPAGPDYVLTTMLFPTGARRLLPTFERPTVKTVYHLTLTVEESAKVIFNTPARSERTVGDRREIVFEPTPPMSAYLLYLGIGPFDTLTVPGERWSVTVAASPGRAEAGRFCAERATEILAAYEEYYAAPYPLPKLDLVALENFWAGAMENWGAIAFRETAVLVDPTTSVLARRGILQTLAHEIAHQWFGNLVTAAWWDDFWLNESFATFVGYRLVSHRYPAEDSWSPFLNRWVRTALEADALDSTHPIHVPVDSAEALGEISDAITYGKGAAVLRMVEAYLGAEPFRKGVSRYLREHRYANATAEDLWTALEQVSGRPVSHIMSEWVTRPGFPVVHARWANGRLTLRQERFRADGAAAPALWPIPLRLVTPEGDFETLWESPEIVRPLATPRGVRINPQRTAMVRVHLDDGLFGAALAELPSLDPIDQWGLVTDAHAFVYAGLLSLPRFIDLVGAAASLEGDLAVRSMTAALADLLVPLYDVPALREAARTFLRTQIDRVGPEPRVGETEDSSVRRELVGGILARVDPSFARELAARFADFDRLPAELRGPVALAYALDRRNEAFDPLLARLRAAQRDSERLQMVVGLAALPDRPTARRVLELVPGPGVTPSRTADLLLEMSGNPTGRAELFDWFRDHGSMLSELWAGTPLLSLFLRRGLARLGIDSPEAVEEHFRSHIPSEAAQAVRQGLESLRLATRLRRAVRSGPSGSVADAGDADPRPGRERGSDGGAR